MVVTVVITWRHELLLARLSVPGSIGLQLFMMQKNSFAVARVVSISLTMLILLHRQLSSFLPHGLSRAGVLI
jgi:hypothetical protein